MEEFDDTFSFFLDCMPNELEIDTISFGFDPEMVRDKMERWDLKFDMPYTWSFNVESWIKELGDLTFQGKGVFIELSATNMEYICAIHQAWLNHKLRGNGPWDVWSDKRIADFKTKIVKALKTHPQAFIRLSSRSPKDCPGGLRPLTTSSAILGTLARSTRAYDDCSWALMNQSTIGLWIFPWKHNVKFDNEFRCFVFKDELPLVCGFFLGSTMSSSTTNSAVLSSKMNSQQSPLIRPEMLGKLRWIWIN